MIYRINRFLDIRFRELYKPFYDDNYKYIVNDYNYNSGLISGLYISRAISNKEDLVLQGELVRLQYKGLKFREYIKMYRSKGE